jgi:hypothetical protein
MVNFYKVTRYDSRVVKYSKKSLQLGFSCLLEEGLQKYAKNLILTMAF